MRFRKLKQQKKQTPQKQKNSSVKHFKPAYSAKIKAFIIDMFMIYAPILYLIAYAVLGGKEDFQNSQLAPLAAVGIYGLLYAFLLSKFAQTPGKKAYDLKVLDAKTGEQISFLRALFRFLAFLLAATSLFGLLLPLFRKDTKALHDLLSETIEVREERLL